MTRKRKVNKKTRTPRTKSLEHLLQTKEPETYWQHCWSVANRDTRRSEAGEVVKLGGGEKTGRWTGERLAPGATSSRMQRRKGA